MPALDYETACDPEEAGIILDRLAGEVERANAANPSALDGLRRDAEQFLDCIEPWLEEELGELAPVAQGVPITGEPRQLAGGLRALAGHLLDIAERLLPSEPGDEDQ